MSGHTRIGLMTSDDALMLAGVSSSFKRCISLDIRELGMQDRASANRASARDAPTFHVVKSRLMEDYERCVWLNAYRL
jgi:hypothetical protein